MSFGNSFLDVLLVVMSALFIAQVTYRAPWWRNQAARSIIFLAASVMLIPLPKVLALMFGYSTKDGFYLWAELICKIPVVLALAWIMVTFEVVREQGRRKDVLARRLRLRSDQEAAETPDVGPEGPVEPPVDLPG